MDDPQFDPFDAIETAALRMLDEPDQGAFLQMCAGQLERMIFERLREQNVATEREDRETAARIARKLTPIIAMRRHEIEAGAGANYSRTRQ